LIFSMPEVSSRYPIVALSALIFGHFLNHFYAYVLGASLFIIREDITLTNAQVGLVGTAQIVVFAVFSIFVGIIGDRWLRSKNTFVPLGVLLLGASMFIVSYAQGLKGLIFAALLTGFGASFYHPVAYASIADLFEEKKGIAMGFNTALGMIGTSITPVVIASFQQWIGWRKSFIIFGIIAIVLALLMFVLFHFMISYKRTSAEVQEIEQNRNLKREQKFSNWMKKELFVVLTIIIIICLFFSVFRSGIFRITNQFLSIIFVDNYGFALFDAGWITTVILVIGGFTSIAGGLLSDKVATSLTMLISASGSAVMLTLLVILGNVVSGVGAVALFFIFIAFLYFSAAASTKYVSENVPQKSRSLALGFLFAIPSALAGVFPWFFGWILDNSTFTWSFVFLLVLAAASTVMAFLMFWRDWKKGKFNRGKIGVSDSNDFQPIYTDEK
jgi:MFS family permease